MRLGISNIAWDVAEDEQVAALLKRYDIDAIDIAPGKYFPKPAEATTADIIRVKQWWASRGIEITGMQSLLFGTTGLNVFGAEDSQAAMLNHLAGVCRIAGILGSPRLVFGSPKNRDRSGLSDEETMQTALNFFQRLGDIALAEKVIICLEPNPVHYGANFMTTSAETAHVVRSLSHPAIRMQLDTGAMTINKENPAVVIAECADLIGHIHASEPDLVPVGDGAINYSTVIYSATYHREVHAALLSYLPDAIVSIEMVATQQEPHLISIERALNAAIGSYRSASVV